MAYRNKSTFTLKLQFLILLSFIILVEFPAKASGLFDKPESISFKDSVYEISHFDLKQGERMFYGVVPLSKEAPACAHCHYTEYIDTLNWNPSAFDIASKYAHRNASALMNVINNPTGKKMSADHAGFEISENQAVLLQAYLEKLNSEGKPLHKPTIKNLFLFIFINIIGLLFTIDLIFLHKIRFRIISLLVIIASFSYSTRTVIIEGINNGRQPKYAPLQPIKFSHYVHASQNQIDCQYCHNLAERSKNAGIPSVNVCMNCHIIVVEGTRSGKFEINKVRQAYDSLTPIQWVKIHNLPDHVFFSHAQHVKVGKLDCMECHGDVKKKDVITQVNTITMGWCLNCHRTKKVDFENNKYYALFEEYHEKIKQGKMDSVLVKDIGGTNCMKCHY
jgi:hypothetical protein